MDIRNEEYQKKHYSKPVNFNENITYKVNNYKYRLSIVTQKYWKEKILSAEEKISIDNNLVQHTTFGWNTYSLEELKKILENLGMVIVDYKLDYYSSLDNLGERLIILSKKIKRLD